MAKSFTISSQDFEPAYMQLYRSGELHKRVAEALRHLESCRVCPRNCEINRLEDQTAICKIGRHAIVSSYFAHFGEEDCLRGTRGSGTIFFSMCNLRCVFCQNYEISQLKSGVEVNAERLAEMMLELQENGCHNINFVTPEHVVPQVLEAIPIAVGKGLRLPIVYNTSAYDSLQSLWSMEGIVDIYMPDLKYLTTTAAKRYLKAEDYPQMAKAAIREMYRQVGNLVVDEFGLAKRGVMVRHLVMPGSTEEIEPIMRFLVDVSPDIYVNIMDQYHPTGKVNDKRYPEINRRIHSEEYHAAKRIAREVGVTRFDIRSPLGFLRMI